MQTLSDLRPFYDRRPSRSTLQRMDTKFKTTGSVNVKLTSDRPRVCKKVCRSTRGCEFLAMHKNSAFRRLQLGEFCVVQGSTAPGSEFTRGLLHPQKVTVWFGFWVLLVCTLLKTTVVRPLQSTVSTTDNRRNMVQIRRCARWQRVFPPRWHYISHSGWRNSRRFDSARVFLVWFPKVAGLCQ